MEKIKYMCDVGQDCGCTPLTGCQGIPARKWPPLDMGIKVLTDLSGPIAEDWTPEALIHRRHNAVGHIIHYHDSHGLCYEVKHEDGTVAAYEPQELKPQRRYEVFSSRHDVAEHLYTSFIAGSDEEALLKFTEIKCKPDMAWERLRMVEVLQERKERFVVTNHE